MPLILSGMIKASNAICYWTWVSSWSVLWCSWSSGLSFSNNVWLQESSSLSANLALRKGLEVELGSDWFLFGWCWIFPVRHPSWLLIYLLCFEPQVIYPLWYFALITDLNPTVSSKTPLVLPKDKRYLYSSARSLVHSQACSLREK